MKVLNGITYFEQKDVVLMITQLILDLDNRQFIQDQFSPDVVLIQEAIKKFLKILLISLQSENAVNCQYIEGVYTRMMFPAESILDPTTYSSMSITRKTSAHKRKRENWFFNYGIALVVSEFEKNIA